MSSQSSHTSEMELIKKSSIREKKLSTRDLLIDMNIEMIQMNRIIELQPVSVKNDKFRSGNFKAINRSVERRDRFAAVLTR